MSTIQYLNCATTIAVETPLLLSVGWGDRVSRAQDAPSVYGASVEVGQLGPWWERHPVTVRARGGVDLTEAQRTAALETYRAVAAAWRAALEDPEIAAAVERYRLILDDILASQATHAHEWDSDCRAIARAFRRRAVVVGEQTVPGKCVVRSTRGRVLGYADCWDGRWLGTIERA